jgi:hypothetical protein
MQAEDADFDLDRYRRLLAGAVDESKRLALIDLLIEERAMDRYQARIAAKIATVRPASRPTRR